VLEILKRASVSQNMVSYRLVDFEDLSSIQKFSVDWIKSGEPIHIFVSNAGIAESPSSLTRDKVPPLWQVNYLAPWLMINELLPVMIAASQTHSVRIVSVSSGAHKSADIDLIPPGHGNVGYGQSKLAQIMHMKQLQKKFDDQKLDIRAVSCTPGMTRSPMIYQAAFSNWKRALGAILVAPLFFILSRSREMGAQCIIHCCLDPDVKGGHYYSNCYEKLPEGKCFISQNVIACAELWDLTAGSLLKLQGKIS